MSDSEHLSVKKNVAQFDKDVSNTGSYAYTANRLSSRYANEHISEQIAKSYPFAGKSVLDLGCGDGTYTLELLQLGATKIVGLDPAEAAIDVANAKARRLGVDTIVKFEVGNIYALDAYFADKRFDCILLRGVLHHLPDPVRAIAGFADFTGTIIILEPNGNNPVLKLLEKFSRYHIDHEERSYSPRLILSWLNSSGFHIKSSKFFNLVPMFCPNWMARTLRIVGPVIERLPLIRNISCGQVLVVAEK